MWDKNNIEIVILLVFSALQEVVYNLIYNGNQSLWTSFHISVWCWLWLSHGLHQSQHTLLFSVMLSGVFDHVLRKKIFIHLCLIKLELHLCMQDSTIRCFPPSPWGRHIDITYPTKYFLLYLSIRPVIGYLCLQNK